MSSGFEIGPIRPPSEATSILIRITRNCPWNRCKFCPVYKGQQFSFRTVPQVKNDIDTIAKISIDLQNELKNDNSLAQAGIITGISRHRGVKEDQILQVLSWLQYGMKNLFLQDGDSLVIKTESLVEILDYIKHKLSSIERITSYSRARTIFKKSKQELMLIRNAGLNRLHLGLESGSIEVLEKICKGVTPGEQIQAGQKAMDAGFELSEYYMPGLGGHEFSRIHAVESARVLNQINPSFLRLRTTIPLPGTGLFKMMQSGKWERLSEEQIIQEIKCFISHLHLEGTIIKSDHMMNLIEDFQGRMPQDKQKLIDLLDSFLEMSIDDKESFILGRRLGYYRFFKDYRPSTEIEGLKKQLKSKYTSIEDAIRDMPRSY